MNEEYTVEQLTLPNQVGAAVLDEITYRDGKAEKSSVDGIVVYPDQVIFVEVKGLRPGLPPWDCRPRTPPSAWCSAPPG